MEHENNTALPAFGARILLEREREKVMLAAARHLASNIRVFGSVARGDDGPDSDIDLLVDFEPHASLLDLIALKQELEQLLNRRTDVVTTDSVSPFMRQRILDEARPL
ncbi:MAG: nucleotidyltransferase family protein [Pseudomonadota bacterium]